MATQNQPTPGHPHCPACGSSSVVPLRKDYDGGLGCLGLILFGWWGLLLGLLGGNQIEMYCQNCGFRWMPQGNGCFSGCFQVIAAIITAAVIIFLVMILLAAVI